jgi:DNA-binding MarR family transcriptional regulator
MPASTPDTTTERDTAVQLRRVIGRLSRRLRPTAAGASAGLSPTRAAILLSVVRDGPVRLAELAADEGINPTMLSRAIGALVDGGYVERTCDPQDRRAAFAAPTAAGKRLAERMRSERTDAVKLALASLEPAQRAQLEDALPTLEAFAELLKGPRP